MAINVLIVDDSAVVRQVLTQQLDGAAGIKVIGAASDPIFAMKKMASQWPDVIVLDIEMPRMDGITFLKKIMAERPTPVVICSTLAGKGADATMQALAAGAIDVITKPKAGLKGFLQEQRAMMIDAIKAAAMAKVGGRARAPSALPVTSKLSADAVIAPCANKPMSETTDKVIAIGTSTGGTQALEAVLVNLPRTAPGIVVVQHMPENFTAAFAGRLNSLCQMNVKEAEHNDRVVPGQVLIANGGKHMLLIRSGAQYRVELKDGPLVSRHRPSVDVLFRSVAKAAGANAVGIIMTGMGDDGARGLKEMHDAGAYTAAQDEKTCVVYGMPKEAVKLGGVDIQLPLQRIPELIMKAIK
ncbi:MULTISPECIES: chemotaxis response regulator protein-glutamate methylesterase [unclassified Motilimonas]|uniref:protein-glutamate methylesterase/protein-glutamine glutaminase n=1 Tax=unclassified Motilimonas TaxID=2643697 RepID=UPI001E3F3A49|nr:MULTISPECIES: chemotaxis response regulator protein-glutamate methylesterase [unclassified Motilimonas]MCE0558847.1 chemotaxis response regulator protein-glutamate methylesterase [Motilimonas sp. E26]MDO6526840.1 chemotaxis response regulator protein-glutamate methylesterase [Motilimonas sp. 1_MG-2023]